MNQSVPIQHSATSENEQRFTRLFRQEWLAIRVE